MKTYTLIITVRRSWKKRLFSWPWRPWVATREIHEKIELPDVIKAPLKSPPHAQAVSRVKRQNVDSTTPSTPHQAPRRLDDDDNLPLTIPALDYFMSFPSTAVEPPQTYSGITSGGGGDFGGGGASGSWSSDTASSCDQSDYSTPDTSSSCDSSISSTD
jgi:hypothetical protein